MLKYYDMESIHLMLHDEGIRQETKQVLHAYYIYINVSYVVHTHKHIHKKIRRKYS